MKLLMVTVSSPEIKKIRRNRYINFQQSTMPYLAAFFPDDWQIIHVDEECEVIDFNKDYDLVALTFHTPCAPYAYNISSRFRKKGIPVIMGGPHVTLLPDEAQHYADAIFVGEAENTFPQFIKDFIKGDIKRRYDCIKAPDLCGIPFSKKELFHRKDHSGGILTATRGCPNACEFCAIPIIYRHKLRRQPVSEVAAEYASFRGKIIIFWDDNISADLAYAKDLFRSITPYKKWWSSQAGIAAGSDNEFLELAAKSGCKQFFIGFESVSQKSLNSMDKSFNKVDSYKKVIKNIQAHGIAVQAGIVFGFDEDTVDIFDETVEFLEETGIQNATFNILTPYPGTPLFNKLEGERRILTYDWAKYNARTDVVFKPKQMSCEDLLAGFNRVNQRFYSFASIRHRMCKSLVGLYWTLPLNLIYHYKL